jgi:hypothetical protein
MSAKPNRRGNTGILAVLTGDIVGSRRLTADDKGRCLELLRATYRKFAPEEQQPIQFFRGDAFQAVLRPSQALQASLFSTGQRC